METIRHLDNFDDVVAASLAEVDARGDEIISGERDALRDPSSTFVRTLGQLGSTEVTLGSVPEEPGEPRPAPPKPEPNPDPMP
jgi:hypothetical protein